MRQHNDPVLRPQLRTTASMSKLNIPIPVRSLFHFAIPCYYQQPLWGDEGALLSEAHRLPDLSQVEGEFNGVEVRAGWNEEAFAAQFRVFNPKLLVWTAKGTGSVFISVWINTRAAQDIHRATRFCHWFEIEGCKGRTGVEEARVTWRAIPRAKETPNSPPPQTVIAKAKLDPDRRHYCVNVLFKRESLTGYDPREYPQIGFNYEVMRAAVEPITFSAGAPLRYQDDPSLWITLDLVKP